MSLPLKSPTHPLTNPVQVQNGDKQHRLMHIDKNRPVRTHNIQKIKVKKIDKLKEIERRENKKT